MPPLLLPGLEPVSPGTPTLLTRVRCLSLKPDMDREVRSHPDSRISAKVQSWELGLSRVFRPDDNQNHPELRHVSSLHYRLLHQSCPLRQQSYQLGVNWKPPPSGSDLLRDYFLIFEPEASWTTLKEKPNFGPANVFLAKSEPDSQPRVSFSSRLEMGPVMLTTFHIFDVWHNILEGRRKYKTCL
jgi:hypothetical protein